MFVWILVSYFAITSGLKVFESDIIKRIFEQDPTFCFRPFSAEGCSNKSLWESVPVPENYTGAEPKTTVLLFTPRNTRHPEFLHRCGGQLPSNTNFNPRHKTEVFIHGYLDGACRSAWMRSLLKSLGPIYRKLYRSEKIMYPRRRCFYLQRTQDIQNGFTYVVDDSSPRHKTTVFVHGSLDGFCRPACMKEMKNELFKRGLYNVILVDWTWGNGPNYTASANNTKIVGKQLAFLIQNIMDQSGAGPENFHLIGHSLGAHIAGFVGKRINHLRRITALDPALTPFQNLTKKDRIDSSDANLVDVIHTNAGTQPGEVIGDVNPLGHADFYPNGGTVQDGCRHQIVKSYLTLDFLYATISLVPRICSHMHAVQYYKASINPKNCEFVGVLCPDYESFASGECITCHKDGSNCAVMGMNHEFHYRNSNLSSTVLQPRKFYLNTTVQYPYCDNSGITFEEPESSSLL